MNTTTISIALSESQWEFVREQATASGAADPAEYLRRLLDEEQKRLAEARLEALLLEGLNSPLRPLTAEVWEEIRREGRQRLVELDRA